MPGLPAPPDTARLSEVERLNLPAQRCATTTSTRSTSSRRSACSSPGPARSARVRRDQRQCPGRRRHRRAAPRHAAGHRAGRRAGQAAQPGPDPGPPRPPPGDADRRVARPAGAPADPARRDRLELRPARRRRAAAARSAGRVPWRLRPADGRGGRRPRRRGRWRRHRSDRRAPGPEPRPARGRDRGRPRTALRDARDDPRVRRRDARDPGRGGRSSVGATPRRSWPWRRRRRRTCAAPTSGCGSTAWSATTTTCGRRSTGWSSTIRRWPSTLAFALWRFWQQRGYLNEARARFEAMAARDWDLEPIERARFAEAFGSIAYWQSDRAASTRWYDEALSLWRRIGDRREIANALYNRAYADMIVVMQGDDAAGLLEATRAMLKEALDIYAELGDTGGEGNVSWGLGSFDFFMADALGGGDLVPPLARAPSRRRRPDDGGVVAAHDRHCVGRHSSASTRRCRSPATRCGTSTTPVTSRASRSSSTTWRSSRQAPVGVERAGRLWGAARRLQQVTGTALADYVEQTKTCSASRRRAMAVGDEALDRLAAEGAAMTPRRGRRLRARCTLRGHPVDARGGDLTMLEPGRPGPAVDRAARAPRRPGRSRPGEVDPAAVILTCANCGAAMDERKCKLICRCGYFLSCSDYY